MMMNKPTKPRNPARSLAALVLATAALLGGWVVFRVAGRGALDACLQNAQGDPAALQGFTLFGQTQHQSANALTTYTLQDGVWHSETQLDTEQLTGVNNWDYSCTRGLDWVIDPADRAAVNATAAADDIGDLIATAPRLQNMVTVYLPNHTTVRFPIASRQGETLVQAYWDSVQGTWTDWQVFDADVTGNGTTLSHSVIPWQGRYCLTLLRTTDLLTAGIYRVDESLTDAQVEAQLPQVPVCPDGSLTADETVAYGTVTPFYTPEGAVYVDSCLPVGDLLAVLWADDANTLYCDLVDAAGQCVEHRTLAEQSNVEMLQINPLPRQRAGEAAFLLDTTPQGIADPTSADGTTQLVLLRVEDGRLTQFVQQTLPQDSNSSTVFAMLDDSCSRLLLINKETDVWHWDLRGYEQGTLAFRYTLEVRDLASGAVLYTADLPLTPTEGPGWGTQQENSADTISRLYRLRVSSYVWFPHLTDDVIQQGGSHD